MVLTFSSYKVLQKGSKAPDFNLPATNEKKYSLKDFEEKNLLIIFMCNHCPYVVPKFDYFKKLEKKYSKDLQIIGINSNDAEKYPEDSFEKMKQYSKEYNFNFVYLFDETQKVAKKYGATCTPDPYLFNKEKKLIYHGRFDENHGGSHNEAKTNEMELAIKQLIAGEKITIETLPSSGCSIKWK